MSEKEQQSSEPWVFPKWHNRIPLIFFGVVGPIATILVIAGVWYYFSPRYTDVGYRPEQPVAYSRTAIFSYLFVSTNEPTGSNTCELVTQTSIEKQ